eukprot:9248275-Alexandrium_andersonii.AAC.1
MVRQHSAAAAAATAQRFGMAIADQHTAEHVGGIQREVSGFGTPVESVEVLAASGGQTQPAWPEQR